MEVAHARLKNLCPSLIQYTGAFAREAVRVPGATRVALVGYITTTMLDPKDVDILVTFESKPKAF